MNDNEHDAALRTALLLSVAALLVCALIGAIIGILFRI